MKIRSARSIRNKSTRKTDHTNRNRHTHNQTNREGQNKKWHAKSQSNRSLHTRDSTKTGGYMGGTGEHTGHLIENRASLRLSQIYSLNKDLQENQINTKDSKSLIGFNSGNFTYSIPITSLDSEIIKANLTIGNTEKIDNAKETDNTEETCIENPMIIKEGQKFPLNKGTYFSYSTTKNNLSINLLVTIESIFNDEAIKAMIENSEELGVTVSNTTKLDDTTAERAMKTIEEVENLYCPQNK